MEQHKVIEGLMYVDIAHGVTDGCMAFFVHFIFCLTVAYIIHAVTHVYSYSVHFGTHTHTFWLFSHL